MDFRERYFEALGTRKASDCETARVLAHEIRKFEIELYWKRATYFWAFQLVAFTALGLLFKDGKLSDLRLLVIPASIGVITAFAGHLTARGSKFWQENWENHVDLLEGEVNLRLTQVIVCSKSEPQFSVTRLNESLLLLITWGWSLVLVLGAIPNAAVAVISFPAFWRGVVLLVAVGSACGWMWRSNRSEFHGRIFHSG
jgi:hypothetical protein